MESREGLEEEFNRRLEKIATEPITAALISRIKQLPLWGLGGGIIGYTALFRTSRRTPMVRIGMSLLGALVGLQAGLWRLKTFYQTADPDYRLLNEARTLISTQKQLKEKI